MDEPQDRTPPHDDGAEQSVVGAMLLSKDAIADVIAMGLRAEHFYRPAHARIFEAILTLYNDGEPADPITVISALLDTKNLGKVGGADYIHHLVSTVPTAANGTYYADIVMRSHRRRELINAGTKIVQLGYNVEDPDDATPQAQQLTFELSMGRDAENELEPMGGVMQATLDAIESSASGEDVGIPTGFTDLDRLLNGLKSGQMIIVAGRPGLGKSTAGLDFARACSIKNGRTSAVFSLEMSKVEINMRILSAESRVPLHLLNSGKLSDDDWTRVARRMGEISDAPLWIDDTPGMTLMEIRAKARRLKQTHDLSLIVVDYLQLMSSPKKSESRQQEVAELSRGLKLLGREIKCPVVAISQLNRGPEQRTDKRPQLSDLRESGSLEQDADVVILLHREDYYDKSSPRAGEADFIVAKHRNGPTDTITVAAQLHLSRFVDMAIA